jgi:hypothetical protein
VGCPQNSKMVRNIVRIVNINLRNGEGQRSKECSSRRLSRSAYLVDAFTS